MNYEQAVKLADTSKTKDNLMVLKLAYDFSLILPHKAGVAVLEALLNAEQLHQNYGEQPHIGGLEPNRLTASLMSPKEYREFKVAGLMGITLEQVREHKLIQESV